ncbi:MAG: hypothetical protein ACR2KG_04985 [Nocardioidaceae bacterium]
MKTHAERPVPQITSPANPRVRWLQGLRKRRASEAHGVSIVEGYEEIEVAAPMPA